MASADAHRPPFLRRHPVTLTFVLALLAVGLATGSAWHGAPRAVIHAAGFRPSDALALDLGRLLGAAWFTTGPWSLVQALALTALGVGLLERRFGSGWAALAFLGLHVLAFLSLALLYVLPGMGGLVRNARDVGASAGYFGALALALGMTPRWRWLVPAFAGALALRWLGTATTSGTPGRIVNAAAEHLFTVVYGGGVGWMFGIRAGNRTRQGP